MKTQIGLGVLSIPASFDTLGMIPGIIILLVIAVITTWSDYMIGVFKLRHPSVYNIDDVGGMLFGRVGRIAFGAAFCLCKYSLFLCSESWLTNEDWIFVAGSGLLTISISLNAMSLHGTCTAIFVAVAAVAAFILGSIRTLSKISWLAWVGVVFIIASSKTILFCNKSTPETNSFGQ